MNILFYTVFEVSPIKGGTERITDTIATGLQSYPNIKCFSAYSTPLGPNFKKTKFQATERIKFGDDFEAQLYEVIKKHEIDIIINQGIGLTPKIRNVLDRFSAKHLISVHHFNPGAEENFFNLHHTLFNLRNSQTLKGKARNVINLAMFPILKSNEKRKIAQEYRAAYAKSDKLVLLSEKFKNEWMAYAGINDDKKFAYIHNALSFSSFFNIAEYDKKEREVLIVSRLDEKQKKLSLALRVWKIIERDPRLNDWKLTIVGHGEEYASFYKNFIQRENLQRVTMEGAQNPVRYYNRASLFMFTSAYEGWGLTLTEAQQFGVVPVAFDSYSSLTDIITDGENGFAIPNGDIESFARKLATLMLNVEMRKEMAFKAIESSKRFTADKICKDWVNLFQSLDAM